MIHVVPCRQRPMPAVVTASSYSMSANKYSPLHTLTIGCYNTAAATHPPTAPSPLSGLLRRHVPYLLVVPRSDAPKAQSFKVCWRNMVGWPSGSVRCNNNKIEPFRASGTPEQCTRGTAQCRMRRPGAHRRFIAMYGGGTLRVVSPNARVANTPHRASTSHRSR